MDKSAGFESGKGATLEKPCSVASIDRKPSATLNLTWDLQNRNKVGKFYPVNNALVMSFVFTCTDGDDV